MSNDQVRDQLYPASTRKFCRQHQFDKKLIFRRSQLGDVEKSTSFPFSGMGAETSNNFDDILNLCSGRFDTDPNVCRIAEEGEFPDTLELLMKDEERTAQ